MALSGVHIACVTVSGTNGASLIGKLIWSETMAAAGTAALSAPDQRSVAFKVSASTSDILVAYGPNPNPTTGPRVLIRQGQDDTYLVQPGDRIAWVAI